MKRLAFALLSVLAACGGVEVPTMEVGGGGVKFHGEARTAYDLYDQAWSDMTKQHLVIRENLNPEGNRWAVENAAARITKNLEKMKSVLVKPEPATLDPYIAFYKEIQKLAQQNRIGGNWVTQLEQKQKEIKLQYAPNDVEIAETVPVDETTAKTAPKDTGKKTSTGGDDLPPPLVENDDDTLPPPDEKASGTKTETTKTDSTPKTSDAVAYRLMYKAWQKSHEDLCAAWTARKEAKERYDEVLVSLRELRKNLDKKGADRLQIYLSFYEKIHDDTKAFTSVPDGMKDEDVLNDLKIVAAGITKDFDPNRKK
jgi:hypothetical protein